MIVIRPLQWYAYWMGDLIQLSPHERMPRKGRTKYSIERVLHLRYMWVLSNNIKKQNSPVVLGFRPRSRTPRDMEEAEVHHSESSTLTFRRRKRLMRRRT